MSTKPVPRLPVVGDIVRSKGRLIEVVTPPPIQPPNEYIFEDVSYQIMIISGDSTIINGVLFNNFYSNAALSAVDEAKRAALDPKWNIPVSGMRIDVAEVIEKCRYVLNQNSFNSKGEGEFYDKEFVHTVLHESHSYGLGEPTRRVIWSSTNPDADPTPSPEYAWWNEPRWKDKK